MPSLEAEGKVVRRQLERVLGSPGFARKRAPSRFLRFAVEGRLAGKDDELKESVIAVEVFGRSPASIPVLTRWYGPKPYGSGHGEVLRNCGPGAWTKFVRRRFLNQCCKSEEETSF
jgi:hypothetical protein